MERMMSVEDKIRRAEEIYERRRQGEVRPVAKVTVNGKKDIKLLRKMLIQLLVCVSIYLIIYTVHNNQYIFSEDFIKKANEILSYDTNFNQLYEIIKNKIIELIDNSKNIISPQESIGGSDEEKQENNDMQNEETQITENNTVAENSENIENLSQAELDIRNVKNTTTFIKPIEGVISSKYGRRDTATGSVPKNHTGTDIAASMGTKIKASTDGEVVLSSEEGDYRKTFKNTDRRSQYNLCSL